jgi:hypothetical protein
MPAVHPAAAVTRRKPGPARGSGYREVAGAPASFAGKWDRRAERCGGRAGEAVYFRFGVRFSGRTRIVASLVVITSSPVSSSLDTATVPSPRTSTSELPTAPL